MKLKIRQLENFEYNDEDHTYKLNGEYLTGVTTILRVRAKEYLVPWAAKETADYLLPRFEEIRAASQKRFEELLKEAKKAHTKKSGDAKDSGKTAHKWIEQYILSQMTGNARYSAVLSDEKARKAVDQFLEWEKEHQIEWLASELILASVQYKFAGTIDAVAKIDGVMTVVDFKTSAQISDEYFLQTAAYWLLLRENSFPDQPLPTARLILRIPKTGNKFEAMHVPTPLKFDCETFLRCREIHRWNLLADSWLNTKVEAKPISLEKK